jgi:hypothetical protein
MDMVLLETQNIRGYETMVLCALCSGCRSWFVTALEDGYIEGIFDRNLKTIRGTENWSYKTYAQDLRKVRSHQFA